MRDKNLVFYCAANNELILVIDKMLDLKLINGEPRIVKSGALVWVDNGSYKYIAPIRFIKKNYSLIGSLD